MFIAAAGARFAVPTIDTRAGVALRDTTVRAVWRGATAVRVATVRAGVCAAVVRVATARPDAVVRDGVTAPPARDGVARAAERGLVVVARAADVVTGVVKSAPGSGSAKAVRIDKNVEHTKNAAANKNTVPNAFLKTSPKLRLFIRIPFLITEL